MAAHCSALIAPVPGVGEEIDDDVLGADAEEVVARRLEDAAALGHRGHPDRLDGLDAKRFDDRAGHGPLARRKRRAPRANPP
jgi:hypothetical protein